MLMITVNTSRMVGNASNTLTRPKESVVSGLVGDDELILIAAMFNETTGTTAPLILITISRVLGFSVYQQTKYAIDGMISKVTGDSPLALVNTPGTYPNLSTTLCFGTAGAISGVATTLFTCKFFIQQKPLLCLIAKKVLLRLRRMPRRLLS
jgi:hypothetical protein